MKRRATPREETKGVRECIIDAALAILQESGVESFTQVNIADRAGVRQSHLTYYFPTNQDLLDAVVGDFVARVARTAERVTNNRQHDVEAMLSELLSAVADTDHMRMFLGMIVKADRDPRVRDMLVTATRQIETSLAEHLSGPDATKRARMALAAMWGLGLYEFVVRPTPRASVAQPYLAVIEAATRAEPPGPRSRKR